MTKLIRTATALTLLLGCTAAYAASTSAVVAQTETEPSTLERAWGRLKEATDLAGDAAREEAVKLRQRAQEAMDDAGPLVDKARDMANQLRDNLQDSAEQAARDLSAAAQDLDERIRSATGTPVEQPSDVQATLPPVDQLNTDTRAAAMPRPADTVPDYVGVWAKSPAACAQIDQKDATDFAVITPTTIRQVDRVCNMASPSLTDGKATAQASCYADGEEAPRDIVLNLPSPDTLRIGTGSRATPLIRCHLPE
ncbi:hypothetical protein JYU29_07550 [Tianweitania sp. BSSL-BM11]|uniref:Uncharacterized protein n=1 Tax=Tianweitania aestuarii TaxID=2814886 RepID=A0ABS5RXX5_9HYPH|nr:hypothetical protein [Tianweitania aestuarii]MBS9720537.1 hypothetical protein [Tianweitania aestuarii]